MMSYADEVMALISWIATQMIKGTDKYGRKSKMSVPNGSKSPYVLVAERLQ